MMLRKLTRDQAIGFDEKTGELFPIDPESLRDVDLDSTIDGKTPLELCLDKFKRRKRRARFSRALRK